MIRVKQGLGLYGAQGLAGNPQHRRARKKVPDRIRKDGNSKGAYLTCSNAICT